MSAVYSELIFDHYRFSEHRGQLEGAEASCEYHNSLCGDTVRVELRFDPPLESEVCASERCISTMRFSGEGCAISQAAASLLSKMVSGRPVSEAHHLSADTLYDALEITLTPSRQKCALLSLTALKKALEQL